MIAESTKQLYCWADWELDGYSFTLLAEDNQLPHYVIVSTWVVVSRRRLMLLLWLCHSFQRCTFMKQLLKLCMVH